MESKNKMVSNLVRDRKAFTYTAVEYAGDDCDGVAYKGFKAGWDSCKRHDPDVLALYDSVSAYREYFNATKEGEYENNRRSSPLRDYEINLQLEADKALSKFKESK